MARKRLSMRQIKEVLRLHFESKLSQRAISKSCGLARSTVDQYLRLFASADIPWPLPDSMFESELVEKLRPLHPKARPKPSSRPLPDWGQLHQQLRGKNVTLKQLWKEPNQTTEIHRRNPVSGGKFGFTLLTPFESDLIGNL